MKCIYSTFLIRILTMKECYKIVEFFLRVSDDDKVYDRTQRKQLEKFQMDILIFFGKLYSGRNFQGHKGHFRLKIFFDDIGDCGKAWFSTTNHFRPYSEGWKKNIRDWRGEGGAGN